MSGQVGLLAWAGWVGVCGWVLLVSGSQIGSGKWADPQTLRSRLKLAGTVAMNMMAASHVGKTRGTRGGVNKNFSSFPQNALGKEMVCIKGKSGLRRPFLRAAQGWRGGKPGGQEDGDLNRTQRERRVEPRCGLAKQPERTRGGPRQLAMRTRRVARDARFWRWDWKGGSR